MLGFKQACEEISSKRTLVLVREHQSTRSTRGFQKTIGGLD
jgi:hypothetical protein